MEGAILLLAAFRKESEIYTPYLLGKVVFVPFQATTPPPQDRIWICECWIHAVPKPELCVRRYYLHQ
jgi:hypothetical protein